MKRIAFIASVALALLFLLGPHRAFSQGATKLDAMPRTPALAAQMLAHSSVIVVKVPDYDTARQEVLETATSMGAELLDAKTQVNQKGKKHGWVSLRIDAARLPSLLPALQSVGKLYSDNLQTADNISEYEVLARRIERLQQHEARLAGILQSPRHMRGSDILFLQERLFRASVDESQLAQQRLDLQRAALASTVRVELFEPGALPIAEVPQYVNLGHWFANSLAQAHAVVNRQMARGATAAAYLVVYAPFWLPALLIAVLLMRWIWLRRARIAAAVAGTIGTLIAWLRAAWDARHRPIGPLQSTE